MHVTGTNFVVDATELRTLLDADLLRVKDDIEDICDSADKQMQIDAKLSEVRGKWSLAFTNRTVWSTQETLAEGDGQVVGT